MDETRQNPTHRRTSVYTIRLGATTPGLVHTVASGLLDRAIITDLGSRSVSFRAPTGDAGAYQIALDAMAGVSGEWHLTTGLGVHRRTISTD